MPPFLRVELLSTCWNSSKMRFWSSGAMPGPVSRTAMSKKPSAAPAAISTEPLSVNLMALPTRLSSTCVSRRSSPRPIGSPSCTFAVSASPFALASDSVPESDRLHDLPDGVVVERERELAGLDLRQIEHVVDEPEEVPAVGLDALQRLERLVRQLAVEPVGHHLGEAEDGVHRRAQLVAHVGEELRLVPAGDLELAALLLDLAEQARVLDREHGLRREGLQEVDGRFREQARLLAAHHEGADDASERSSGTTSSAAVARFAGRCPGPGCGGSSTRSGICSGSRALRRDRRSQSRRGRMVCLLDRPAISSSLMP